jgi:hypothetical protein
MHVHVVAGEAHEEAQLAAPTHTRRVKVEYVGTATRELLSSSVCLSLAQIRWGCIRSSPARLLFVSPASNND